MPSDGPKADRAVTAPRLDGPLVAEARDAMEQLFLSVAPGADLSGVQAKVLAIAGQLKAAQRNQLHDTAMFAVQATELLSKAYAFNDREAPVDGVGLEQGRRLSRLLGEKADQGCADLPGLTQQLRVAADAVSRRVALGRKASSLLAVLPALERRLQPSEDHSRDKQAAAQALAVAERLRATARAADREGLKDLPAKLRKEADTIEARARANTLALHGTMDELAQGQALDAMADAIRGLQGYEGYVATRGDGSCYPRAIALGAIAAATRQGPDALNGLADRLATLPVARDSEGKVRVGREGAQQRLVNYLYDHAERGSAPERVVAGFRDPERDADLIGVMRGAAAHYVLDPRNEHAVMPSVLAEDGSPGRAAAAASPRQRLDSYVKSSVLRENAYAQGLVIHLFPHLLDVNVRCEMLASSPGSRGVTHASMELAAGRSGLDVGVLLTTKTDTDGSEHYTLLNPASRSPGG